MNISKKHVLVFGAIALVASTAFAFRRTAASMGTVELKGGSVKVEFAGAALSAGGTVNITGVVKNSNSGTVKYGDLTVSVTGKDYPTAGSPPPSPVPPDMNSSTLTKSGDPNPNTDTGPASVPNGEQTHHESLPGGDMSVNDTLTLDIDMTGIGNAGTVVVTITPSAPNKPAGSGVHADVVESWEIEGGRPGGTHVCSWTTHDRVVTQVINVDARDAIVGLSGSVGFPGGSGLGLSSVSLQDPDNSHASLGSVSVTGNNYTITGLNLGTSRRAELVAVFSGTPSVPASISLTVNATLD